MILPKSYSHLPNDVLQNHLQVLLWKVADQQVPHNFDETARSVLLLQSVTTTYDPGQLELIDVIQCQCKARENKYITDACDC